MNSNTLLVVDPAVLGQPRDCFVAGTLVHTDKGLVPIEQLKVGDRVLSKHESGEGEQAYKRVVRTFKSEEKKKITFMEYEVIENNETTGMRYLFCTEDHPFWAMEYGDDDNIHPLGWKPAVDLSNYRKNMLTIFNGNFAIVSSFYVDENSIYEVDNSKVVDLHNDSDDPIGLYDFRGEKPVCLGGITYKGLHPTEIKSPIEYGNTVWPDIFRSLNHNNRNPYYDYVYNIKVEDFHTYYVGEAGVWVHNGNDRNLEQH